MFIGLRHLGLLKSSPVLGPNTVTNGTFDVDLTGWTTTIGGTGTVVQSGGAAVITGDGTNTSFLAQSLTVVVGQQYILQLDVINQQIGVNIGTTLNGGQTVSNSILTVGTGKTIVFVAQANPTFISFGKSAVAGSTIDNITVRSYS